MKICVLGTRGFPLIQGGVEKHCESLYTEFPAEYRFVIFRRKPVITVRKAYFCLLQKVWEFRRSKQ